RVGRVAGTGRERSTASGRRSETGEHDAGDDLPVRARYHDVVIFGAGATDACAGAPVSGRTARGTSTRAVSTGHSASRARGAPGPGHAAPPAVSGQAAPPARARGAAAAVDAARAGGPGAAGRGARHAGHPALPAPPAFAAAAGLPRLARGARRPSRAGATRSAAAA